MPYKDPDKRRECSRATYHRNKHNGKHHRAARDRWRRQNAKMNEIKDVPCKDCGGRFPPECMDFDHVRGVKRFNIAQSIHRSWPSLQEEMDKCDIVCANCHRIRSKARKRELGGIIL